MLEAKPGQGWVRAMVGAMVNVMGTKGGHEKTTGGLQRAMRDYGEWPRVGGHGRPWKEGCHTARAMGWTMGRDTGRQALRPFEET